jgi:excisionase family DNA binding protein
METQKSPPSFWTKKETSYNIRSSTKTVDRLISDGRIKAFKLGRKVLIYPESVTEENINSIKPKFNKNKIR